MAFVRGSLGEFTVNSVNLSAFCDEMTIAIEVDNSEVTTFGNAWKKFIAGLASATIDIAGKWDPTTTTGPASAIAAIIAGFAAVTFNAEPGGAAVNQGRTGSCLVAGYEEGGAVGDAVPFSASFQVTGAVAFES